MSGGRASDRAWAEREDGVVVPGAALVPGGILESDLAHDGLLAVIDEIFGGGGDIDDEETCSGAGRKTGP